ncbi:MAG: twin-arginine translocase TatA/TatE family subunit [Bacteroidales bacterium]|nr:twin-arginine translocase TatA/TatE family subunit [Bacteroidales bacterium]
MTLLGIIGGQELIIILLIILVLFGAKKIPDLMRGLGRGVKEFKDGMNGTNVDTESKPKTETSDKKE